MLPIRTRLLRCLQYGRLILEPSTSNGIRLETIRLQSVAPVHVVEQGKKGTVTTPVQTRARIEYKGKRKEEEKKWKSTVLKELDAELKAEGKRYSIVQEMRATQATLMRYALNDDTASIISITHQRARGYGPKKMIRPEDDEFIGAALLLVQRDFRRRAGTAEEVNSPDAVSLFFSFANLWDQMRFLGPTTQSAAILLYDTIEGWKRKRKDDGYTEEIDTITDEIKNKLVVATRRFNMTDSALFISQEDRKRIQDRLVDFRDDEWRPVKRQAVDDYGYDKNLSLVDDMRKPIAESEYHGNQYQLDCRTKDDYIKRFPAHIALERSDWIKVDNYCKNKKDPLLISAEQLITNWDWKGKIVASLQRLSKEKMQYPLKGYLAVLTTDEMSSLLMDSVLAICSQGQNLVPGSIFQYDLCSPVMRLVHTRFVQKLGTDEKEILSAVFDDYVTLFDNSEVSRQYNHRQWWIKCCKRYGVDPDYQAPFGEFHSQTRQQLGVFLMEVVMEACSFPGTGKNAKAGMLPAFSIKNVSIEEESRLTDDGRVSLAKMVSINNQLLALLEEHQFDNIMFGSHQLPVTVPPRPWIDYGMGGPEFTRRTHILRNLQEYKRIDVNVQMRSRLQNPAQARPVFDALNQLGATPWIINKSMLDVLCEVFSMSADISKKELLETLSVPQKADTVVIPEYVALFGTMRKEEIDKERWKIYATEKREALKMRNELNSLWYWMMYRIVLARHFRDDVLFFPHNMDFRGRVYPISPYLSHMGDDVNRCILKFAKGKKLGPDGLNWLKIHCINLTGTMKRKSVADRLAEADRLLSLIIDSANSPLEGKRWWLESEEPWQTLAACMEIRDALAFEGDPADFVSHLAVHQDGSCNGLQHYAALGRDKQGGLEVNLMKSEVPNDVYSSVAARVEQKRIADEASYGEKAELAKLLRQALPQVMPRKVIKQTVMTTVYGVTTYGAVLQVKRQLKALGIANDDLAKFASYVTAMTFASLNDSFTSSMQLKDWFRQCAKGTSELMRTIEWVTPLGLPVAQPYMRAKDKEGKLILAPVSTKQVDAFPPNFVHSLDSTHMMLTSLDCARRGVTFAAVHDCFWTHASTVDEMNKICRQQFVQLHSQPIVEQCSEWLLSTYLPQSLRSHMTPEEAQRFESIFSPRFTPGQLNIHDVKDSVYFFS